jgi:hypothetical protein
MEPSARYWKDEATYRAKHSPTRHSFRRGSTIFIRLGSDARVAVVQGVLKVGFGDTFDLEHLKSYLVGTFLYVPANAKHTMAADEDTIIIGTAAGPWHTHHPEEHR